jgi:hypothetical protein
LRTKYRDIGGEGLRTWTGFIWLRTQSSYDSFEHGGKYSVSIQRDIYLLGEKLSFTRMTLLHADSHRFYVFSNIYTLKIPAALKMGVARYSETSATIYHTIQRYTQKIVIFISDLVSSWQHKVSAKLFTVI